MSYPPQVLAVPLDQQRHEVERRAEVWARLHGNDARAAPHDSLTRRLRARLHRWQHAPADA